MILLNSNKQNFFDSAFREEEQLPRIFKIDFRKVAGKNKMGIRIVLDDRQQLGDIVNDNSHKEDFYRFHDIFHCSFATLLGWSPCTRVLMKCKRKSNPLIDEIEDGARATITEEA